MDISRHQQEFRVVLLNTKKTALYGGILIALPVLFVIGLVLSRYLHADLKVFTFFYDWIVQQENRYGNTSTLNWLLRIFFLLAPLAAIILNLLGIVHARYEKPENELIFSIRLRWLNIAIILVCCFLLVQMLSFLTSGPSH